MAQITFSVAGDIQLSRNLRILADNISDIKPFYKDAIKIIGDRSDEIFKTKGRNVQKNPRWKGLNPSTTRARQKRWGYYKNTPNRPSTLRWTGNLQENRTEKISPLFGSLTFNAPYAPFHQVGGKHLPKRAIIDLDNKTNREIVRSLQKKIEKDIGIFGRQV